MTIIGPWPHWEKQPALLTRTSVLRPALTDSSRRYFTNCSTLPWVGHESPEVHTKTCVSYCPISLGLHGRCLRGLTLGDELVDFLAHRLHDLLLGYLPDHVAVLEDEADPATSGNTDVRRARLAGPVDFTSHDGDVDLLVQSLELVLDLLRELDQVDVGPAAGGTRDEGQAALSEAERLQDVDPDAHFFGRIRGERHADRVADSFREQGAEPDRGLDRADARRPGLGHAEVERVVDLVGKHAVGLDHHQGIGGLQRDLHLRIIQVFQDLDVTERGLDHALGGGPVVPGQEVLLERAAVDADPDGDPLVLGDVDDLLDESLAADVPGIQTQAVHALLERDEGQLVIEVDVGDQRDPDLPLDLAELLGGLADGNRAAHDVAARGLERPDLEQRRVHVACVGLGHGLHGDRRVSADLDPAHLDLSRLSPCDHCAALSEDLERIDPDEVIVNREDHQEQQKNQPELLGRLALPERHGPAQDPLDDEEQQMAAVQHGHRQEVEDGEVHADDRGEEGEGAEPLATLTLPLGRDLDRPAQVRQGQLERDELPEPLGREDSHVPRLHDSVTGGHHRVVRLVADHLGDDTHTDAADLEVLAGGAFLLHGGGRHPHRHRLAFALDADLERLAAALLDRLHELLGREHRLTGHRVDRVAGPESRPLGRRVRVHGADLRCELRTRAEIPHLALFLEDRVPDHGASRRDLDLPPLRPPHDRQPERAALRGRDRAIEILPEGDRTSVDRAHDVARAQVGGRGTVGGDASNDGRPHRASHARQDDAEDDRGQDEVHPGTGEHDQEPGPERLEREGLVGIEGGRAAALQRVLLAHHLHVTAHRNCRQTVLGLLAAPAQEHWAEADGEPLDSDAGPAGHEEVTELVDEDQDADDDDEGQDSVHAAVPPRRESIRCWTTRRVSASTSTHASIEPSSPAGALSSACSMSSAMSVNPIRQSRNAATATSFAAFRTTDALPPLSSAARASLRHGNLSGSGSKNVSWATRVRSSRAAGVGRRSGYVSA